MRWFATSFAILALSCLPLFAEPSVPRAHVPVLWGVAFLGAFLVSRIPLIIKRRLQPQRFGWAFWVASLLLGIAFLVLIGPIIVGLGSILVTGRTM